MRVKNILITDGESRSSLAVTRSLGQRGFTIFVSGIKEKNISSVSKYCTFRYKTKDPCIDANGYFNDICQIVKDNNIDTIFPMTEPSIDVLMRNCILLPHDTLIAAPSLEKIDLVFNKVKIFRLAKELDVPIPETLFIENKQDFYEQENFCVNFPLVIKPGMSRIPNDNGFVPAKIMYAKNRDELRWHYEHNKLLEHPSLIQEMIQGQGTGLFTIFDRNTHLALFSHKRIKEKPPSGGVSVISESIPLDREMVESSHALLSAVGWEGAAMVEFKRDIRDGRPKLMEINGRLWGSLQLAIDCGVDFPSLLVDYIQGKTLENYSNNYETGHRLIWLLGTLDHLLMRLKYSDRELNLPEGFPSRLQTVKDIFSSFDHKSSFDVINRKDMMPFMMELKEYLKDVLR